MERVTRGRQRGGYRQFSRVDVSCRLETDHNMDHQEDSDTEEDPARLLNQWLGELNTQIKVLTSTKI